MSVLMIPRKQNRAADIGKGLAGLAGTIGLVVGVPAALVAWVGSPLPAAMPTASEVLGALRDTYIPDEFLVKLLALVCWLVWVELIASLVVEAVAYARGRKAGSVPLAGGLQRGAARLVAAIALLGVVVAGRSGPSTDRTTQPLASVAPQPVAMSLVDEASTGDVERAGTVADVVDPAEAAAPTYQVQHRDTLWDIAERHLGDPFRWQEIFQLNEGCPQADGRCLSDPDLIFAGWRLELPADAVGLAEVTPPAAPAPPPSTAAPSPVPDGPDGSSVVLDGGMVLINDGSAGSHGDRGEVLVGSGATAAAGAAGGGGGTGMVLLPDGAVPGPVDAGGPTEIAGPAPEGSAGGDAGTPGASASGPGSGDGHGSDRGDDDELAAGPEGPQPPGAVGSGGVPPR